MNYIIISITINFIFFIYLNFGFKKNLFSYKFKKNNGSIFEIYSIIDFIDTIILYLEAGHNIYQSFSYASNFSNNKNIKKYSLEVLAKYSTGCSLIESLQSSINNKNEIFYNEVVEKIILSLQLGTSLKKNLSDLSASLNSRADFDLEEVISRAPVKMIFPLVFFIFPVIFILLSSGFIQDLIKSTNF